MTVQAAMIGVFVMLDDPIFNGLAISYIFGILVFTMLTLVWIPIMNYALYWRSNETRADASDSFGTTHY